MEIRCTFKKMNSSDALRQQAEQKIGEKVEKLSTKPISAHVVFSVYKHQHKVHCSLSGGDGFDFEVEASSEDMYASIDMLVDKLEAQLKRRKERLKKHKNSHNVKQLDPISAIPEEPAMDAEDVIKLEKARSKFAVG